MLNVVVYFIASNLCVLVISMLSPGYVDSRMLGKISALYNYAVFTNVFILLTRVRSQPKDIQCFDLYLF